MNHQDFDRSTVWTREYIDERIKEVKAGLLKGSYSKQDREDMARHVKEHLDVEGKHAMVIGTKVQ